MFCLESKQLATIVVDEYWSFMVAWPKYFEPKLGHPENPPFQKKLGGKQDGQGWQMILVVYLPHMNDIQDDLND